MSIKAHHVNYDMDPFFHILFSATCLNDYDTTKDNCEQRGKRGKGLVENSFPFLTTLRFALSFRIYRRERRKRD